MAPPEGSDWGELFRTCRPAAVRFATGLVRDGALAEDLFQDAARALLEREAAGALRLESREHARNYLFRAVRNLAVSHLRSAAVAGRGGDAGPELAARGPTPLQALLARERGVLEERARQDLERAVAALAPREQEALRLRYGAGLTFREMSERTGAPLSTLQARVEAALAKIRRRVGNPEGRA